MSVIPAASQTRVVARTGITWTGPSALGALRMDLRDAPRMSFTATLLGVLPRA